MLLPDRDVTEVATAAASLPPAGRPAGPSTWSGPISLMSRGTAAEDSAAFAMRDGNYLSSRWPGDAYLFGRRFLDLLEGQPAAG